MAVVFFRMSERGSIKRPTIVALVGFFITAVLAMFILRENPLICIFIVWPIEYFALALIFSSPFRITLGRLMHWTRYHTIMSIPTVTDKLWLDANMAVIQKTGLTLYAGESINKNKVTIDAVRKNKKKTALSSKKINVYYGDDRKEE